MIDWNLTLELSERLQIIKKNTSKLQKKLGISPLTLTQRYQNHLRKKELLEQLKKVKTRGPISRWKA
jgi:hypothetical protein